MVEISNEQSVTWLTADVVELLHQVRMAESAACQSALHWLKEMQNPHGGWYCFRGSIGDQRGTTGDPDSTAHIAFLMGEIYGEEDQAYRRGRELYERSLDECVRDVVRGYRIRLRDGQRVELDAYTLTQPVLAWALEPPRRIEKGHDANDPRVRQIMEALIRTQQEDGGWRPFWSQAGSPLYTLIALEALVLSRMVPRGDLLASVEPYSRGAGRAAESTR